MSWNNRWSEREARPKVKRLSKTEKEQILAILNKGIDTSPVLSALDFRVRTLRGRFYYRKTTTSGSGPKKGSTSVVSMTSNISPKSAVSQSICYLRG